MKKTVAIHQPNFLPWLGYFHKIASCDTFVILDNVQMQKTGGSYVNRVQMAVAGVPHWVTVPIVRNYHGTKLVNEIEISYREPWKEKLLRTLQTNYARAKFFEPISKFLIDLFIEEPQFIAEWNIAMIRAIVEELELSGTELVRASTVRTSSSSTDRLIELTTSFGGSTYLSGGGAGGYQDTELFTKAGIELKYQEFKLSPYDQLGGEFIPGLSIVDALMNLGWEGTRDLIT